MERVVKRGRDKVIEKQPAVNECGAVSQDFLFRPCDWTIRHHSQCSGLTSSGRTDTCTLHPSSRAKGKKIICEFLLMYNLKILFPSRRQPAAFLTLSRLFWVPSSVWINGHCLTTCLCGLSQHWGSEHVSLDLPLHYINWIKDVP